MDPIGIGTSQTPHDDPPNGDFSQGYLRFFHKSWEEDTLQKTEACETGSFQKLRWTWKDVTIAEKKVQRGFFKFTGRKILQKHLIIHSPLRKTYGQKSHLGNTWNPHITPFAAELQAH